MRKCEWCDDGPIPKGRKYCSLKCRNYGTSAKRKAKWGTEGKVCTVCKATVPYEGFAWANGSHTYRRGECRECEQEKRRKHKAKNPQKHKEEHRRAIIKNKYGLSRDDWQRRYDEQNGLCPICKEPIDIFASIDHDHSCCDSPSSCGQCVRGILCRKCNSGLGYLNDDLSLLENAVAYMKEWTN